MSGFGGSENFLDSAEASEDDGMVVGGRCRGDTETEPAATVSESMGLVAVVGSGAASGLRCWPEGS